MNFSHEVDEILESIRQCRNVLAATLCGSHRAGLADESSDIDVWIFVDDRSQLSESAVLDDFLPASVDIENLSEGRDDTIVPFVVLNLVAGQEILNLKYMKMGLLNEFLERTPTLDQSFMDDLENYLTMHVIWEDPCCQLSIWQQGLAERFLSEWRAELREQLTVRYSSYYWRSFYQGILREDCLAWHSLFSAMVEALVSLAWLREEVMPPPKKWLMSARMLNDRLELGPQIERLVREGHEVVLNGRIDDMLATYGSLAILEGVAFQQEELAFGYWWRHVFVDRAQNLRLSDHLYQLIQDKLGPILPAAAS